MTRFTLEDLLDPVGAIFLQGCALYRDALGHNNERRDDFAQSLGVHPDTFRKDLNRGLGTLSKSGRMLAQRLLTQVAEDSGADAIIIPLQGQVRVASGNAIVLDDSAIDPRWEREQHIMLPFADRVVAILDSHSRQVAPRSACALAVVASTVVQIEVFYLANRHRESTRPLRLSLAKPYVPLVCDQGVVTPLERFFLCQAGEDDELPASPEDVWKIGSQDQQRDSKARQLRRWKQGIGDGGRPPNDFICSADYRHPCHRDDLQRRGVFESVLAAQTLFGWMRMKPQSVAHPVAAAFLATLLAVPDDRVADAP